MTKQSLPKFSIITPSYNYGRFLEKTILSIIDQGYDNFEHIIVDNFSTDETLDIVKKYPHIKFHQVKLNAGEASDFGVKKATGDIICFMNCDDFFAPNIFHKVANIFANAPDLMIAAGNFNVQMNDQIIHYVRPSKVMALPYLCWGIIGFNGYFFRKKCFNSIPYIGESNKRCYKANDRDLLIRLNFEKFTSQKLDFDVMTYLSHESSHTISGKKETVLELRKEYVSMSWNLIPYAKTIYQKFVLLMFCLYSYVRQFI